MVQMEDIDIDLDLTEDRKHDEADEDMTEDLDMRPDRPLTGTQDQTETADAFMEDDRISVRDEEIQDVEVALPHSDQDIIVDDILDTVESMPQERAVEAPNPFQRQLRNAEYQEFPQDSVESQIEVLGNVRGTPQNPHYRAEHESEPVSLTLEDCLEVKAQANHYEANEEAIPGVENTGEESPSMVDREAQNVQDAPTFTLDTTSLVARSVSASPFREVNPQPSPHMHPVFVVYEETEMSLFPSPHEDQANTRTYLLQDEQLANEEIQRLLGACRVVLGESIGVEDELEIAIGDLGLCVNEVSECKASPLRFGSNGKTVDRQLPRLHPCSASWSLRSITSQ